MELPSKPLSYVPLLLFHSGSCIFFRLYNFGSSAPRVFSHFSCEVTSLPPLSPSTCCCGGSIETKVAKLSSHQASLVGWVGPQSSTSHVVVQDLATLLAYFHPRGCMLFPLVLVLNFKFWKDLTLRVLRRVSDSSKLNV